MRQRVSNTVITGHAQTTFPIDDLKMYAEFVRDFVNAAREAKQAGRSVDDLANSWKVPASTQDMQRPSRRA